MILDGRFHGKLKGLETKIIPTGNLEGKISIKKVGSDISTLESKLVAHLLSIINYESTPRFKSIKKLEDKVIQPGTYKLSDFIEFEGSINTPIVVKKSTTKDNEYILGNTEQADKDKIQIKKTETTEETFKVTYDGILKVGGTNFISIELATKTLCLKDTKLENLGECLVVENDLVMTKSSSTLMTQNYFVYLQPSLVGTNSMYLIAVFDKTGATAPRKHYIQVESNTKPLRGLAACSFGTHINSFALMIQKQEKSAQTKFYVVGIPNTGTEFTFTTL